MQSWARQSPLQQLHLVLAALGALAVLQPAAAQYPAAVQGQALFYGGPPDGDDPNTPTNGLLSGACGYGLLNQSQWPSWNVTAIGPGNTLAQSTEPKMGCGNCVLATCTDTACARPGSQILLQIVDTCATCGPTQLNLPYLTFEQYLGQPSNNLMVSWQQVDCNPSGTIAIKVVSARSDQGGFLQLVIQMAAGSNAFSGVGIRPTGSSTFTPMTNSFGAAWQASNFGTPPFDVQITSSTGASVIASSAIPSFTAGQYFTNAQIGGVSPPPASPSPPPPVAPAPVVQPPPYVASPPPYIAPAPILQPPPFIASPPPYAASPPPVPVPSPAPSAHPPPMAPPPLAPRPVAPPPMMPVPPAYAAPPPTTPAPPPAHVTAALPSPAAAVPSAPAPSPAPAVLPPARVAPAPAPAPRPSPPRAAPAPAPLKLSPVPAPAPAPRPVPAPRAAPVPAPVPIPAPALIPAPVPAPAPIPAARLAPAPGRSAPQPAPQPAPMPALAPAPSPRAAPKQAPVPQPAPQPTPQPAPQAAPVTAAGPAATTLPAATAAAPGDVTLNLNLSTPAPPAVNGIVNPSVSVAGRRLLRLPWL